MTKQSRIPIGADRRLLIAIIVAVVAMMGILAVNADRVYATDYSGTVYFNLSDGGKPVMSDVTGDPMMMVPVDLQAVADVDLAEWELEDCAYQEYGGDGTQDPERPTALKLFLYMHEQYKDDPQNSITVTGSVHSAYMSMFWGMDENLNYYVNGAYPLFEGGWGATCDGIALEDGDRVDVMHFSDWSFWTDAMAGFNFFADANSDPRDGAIVETYDAVVGEPLPVQVIRGYGSLAIGGATEYHAADDLAIHVSGKDSLIDLNDEEVGTLDGGMAELTFDEPGRYYIWVEGGEGDNGTIVQSSAAAMVEVSASDNRKPKLASGVIATESESINPSQNYSVDLSKIFTDPDGDALTYKLSVNGGDYVACDKDYVYTPSGEGTVTLKFKANDGQEDSDDTYTVNLTISKDVLVKVEGLKIIDDQCREWPIYVLADYETTEEYKALDGYNGSYFPVYKLTLPSAMDFTIVEDSDVFPVTDPAWIKRNIYTLKNNGYVFDKEYDSEDEAHALPVKANEYQGTEFGGRQFSSTAYYKLESLGYTSTDKVVALEVYGAWNQRMQGNYADSYHILIDYDSNTQPSATSHNLTKVEQVDATCTTDGTKAYWTCSNCKKKFSDEAGEHEISQPESIPAGHDWAEPEYTWSDDNKNVTASRVCNTDASHVDKETVDCTFYIGKNPTCEEKGKTVYTAKFTGSAFKTQTRTVDDIKALGHDWGTPTYTWNDDHSKATATRFCSREKCGKTETETVESEVQTVEATCTEDGSTTYVAHFSNTAFLPQHEVVTITAKGHAWGEWKVTKEATEKAEGEKTRICEHDASHVDTQSIPRLTPSNQTDPAKQMGNDGTPIGPGASSAAADKAIKALKNDKDPKGSAFGKLKAKGIKQSKKSVKVQWNKVKGAKKYVIYGNACGKKNKMKKLATVTGASKNFKKVAGKKVKKGKYYKFIVVALDKNNKVISTSKIVHVATKGGKVGNHKSITVQKKTGKKYKAFSKVTIKKGKTLKLKVKLNPVSKKLKVKKYVGVRYESSNKKIATVSGGKINAKAKGTCTIYAYAQNGVYKAIKITVK